MTSPGPVATFYAPANAGWAACLMVDLRARGIDVWDTNADGFNPGRVAADAAGMPIVHSGHPQRGPSEDAVEAVRQRGGRVVVVRQNDAKLSMDDDPV